MCVRVWNCGSVEMWEQGSVGVWGYGSGNVGVCVRGSVRASVGVWECACVCGGVSGSLGTLSVHNYPKIYGCIFKWRIYRRLCIYVNMLQEFVAYRFFSPS